MDCNAMQNTSFASTAKMQCNTSCCIVALNEISASFLDVSRFCVNHCKTHCVRKKCKNAMQVYIYIYNYCVALMLVSGRKTGCHFVPVFPLLQDMVAMSRVCEVVK